MTAIPDNPPPYNTVVFDCDSTLSRIEGIDELARDCKSEVQALTERAMSGSLPLEEAYGARLELIRPTRAELERVAAMYTTEAQPHARELIAALQSLGKRVLVVSGGLLPAVRAFARELGIDAPGDVRAVGLRFDEHGEYAGFDEASPLARSGGKRPVLRAIASQSPNIVLIGDGVTDLEAAPEVQRFIAYGGVAARPEVQAAAHVTCTSADLAALVPLLLTTGECDRLRASGSHSTLLEAAASQA